MYKSFFEATYPARDGRDTIPEDEAIARIAALIIQGHSDLIWHAKTQGILVPKANRSARIESRRHVSPSGVMVKVRGSSSFFSEVAAFVKELANAGF